eukprot:Phypoly_transcript_29064.p1 GENE.Phypoly_transcript_29064~~Phypoly_transcript_29064.p1  ORF type:complete len:113 (-),score=1.63 Phypoly_transcript_29064:106-423(-)
MKKFYKFSQMIKITVGIIPSTTEYTIGKFSTYSRKYSKVFPVVSAMLGPYNFFSAYFAKYSWFKFECVPREFYPALQRNMPKKSEINFIHTRIVLRNRFRVFAVP